MCASTPVHVVGADPVGLRIDLRGLCGAEGLVAVTGGLAADVGLAAALREEAAKGKARLSLETHPQAAFAGALGAAIWAEYRVRKLKALGAESLSA